MTIEGQIIQSVTDLALPRMSLLDLMVSYVFNEKEERSLSDLFLAEIYKRIDEIKDFGEIYDCVNLFVGVSGETGVPIEVFHKKFPSSATIFIVDKIKKGELRIDENLYLHKS